MMNRDAGRAPAARPFGYFATSALFLALVMTPMGIAGCAVGDDAQSQDPAKTTRATTIVPATSKPVSSTREPQPLSSKASGNRTVTEPPLSRADLLALLRSMPGSQDYSVPYETRKAAIQKQVRIIETRGIDFRYDMGKFDRELYEAGISTDVMVALSRNYRAPGAAPRVIKGNNALIGRYAMGIAGSTTRYDRSGSNVVRTDRDVGFAGGGLTIGSDGLYEWRLLSTPDPKYTFRGSWRPATDVETGTYVGPAIVLTNSYEDANWIVTRYESKTPGEHIRVQRIDQRFRSYLGTRKP